MELKSKCPEGPIETRWEKHKFDLPQKDRYTAMLDYLKRTASDRYKSVIEKLNLRK